MKHYIIYIVIGMFAFTGCATSTDKYRQINENEVRTIFGAESLLVNNVDAFARAESDTSLGYEWFVNPAWLIKAELIDTTNADSLTVLIADFNINNDEDNAMLIRFKNAVPGSKLRFSEAVNAPDSIGRTFISNENRILFTGVPSKLQAKAWDAFRKK